MWEGSKTFKWARQISEHSSTGRWESTWKQWRSEASNVAKISGRTTTVPWQVRQVPCRQPSQTCKTFLQQFWKLSSMNQSIRSNSSTDRKTKFCECDRRISNINKHIWAKSVLFITWQLSTKEKTAPWNVNERVIALVTVSVMMCTMMCIDVSWCMDQLCLLESCCRSCQTKCKSILTGRTQNLQPKLCSFL